MFFFCDAEPQWWPYREQLGIQAVVDNLKSKGLPHEWPLKVVDLNNPATLKAEQTTGCYKSQCPHYGGYWLCGGTGSVECKAFGELLPGVVWYKTCKYRHESCPFYKNDGGEL